jgi:putative ABC transport system permease protein
MVVIGKRVSDPWNNGTLIGDIDDPLEIIWTTRSGGIVKNESYTGIITATLKEIGESGLGGPSDFGVYIPITQARDFFNTDEVDMIIVQLQSSDETTIGEVTEAIQTTFGGQVQVFSPVAVLEVIASIVANIELFLGGVAGISLIVAGVGIMNIMIVSLIERTREIGILKALVTKNRVILSIFLSEALIIGLMGALIGVGVGYGLATVVDEFGVISGMLSETQDTIIGDVTLTPVLTGTLGLSALFFGVTVSIIFGLYPAWRVSKLDPVEALRAE